MPMQFKAVLEGVTGKKTSDGRKIFKGVATSLALDRHKEVVVPKGADLSSFMENPVLLRQHEHREEPIGMLTSIDTNAEDMKFEFVFDEADPEAARIMGKVERGFMKTFSIGFLPTKWVEQDELVDDTGKMLDEVEVDIGGGLKQTLNMSRYKATPRRVFTQWELLEVSLVSVPANPEAQMRMMAKELIESRNDMDPAEKSFLEESVNDRIDSLSGVLKEFEKELEDYHLDGVVAPHSAKTVELPFDAEVAQAHLAKWASSNASGDKETISWGKYARGFGKFDVGKKDTFGAYILLHHDVENNELVVSKTAVAAAMTTLLGKGKDAEVGKDGAAIHAHLSQHYRDLGLEVPDFEATYASEDLAKIADGTWTKPVEASEPVKEVTAPEPASDDRIVKLIDQIEKFREMIETRAIGFNIKFETILESVSEINRVLATKSVEAPAAAPEEDGQDEEDSNEGKATEALVTNLKDALAFYKGGAGEGN